MTDVDVRLSEKFDVKESVNILRTPCSKCGCGAYDADGETNFVRFVRRLAWAADALQDGSHLVVRADRMPDGQYEVKSVEFQKKEG